MVCAPARAPCFAGCSEMATGGFPVLLPRSSFTTCARRRPGTCEELPGVRGGVLRGMGGSSERIQYPRSRRLRRRIKHRAPARVKGARHEFPRSRTTLAKRWAWHNLSNRGWIKYTNVGQRCAGYGRPEVRRLPDAISRRPLPGHTPGSPANAPRSALPIHTREKVRIPPLLHPVFLMMLCNQGSIHHTRQTGTPR